MDGDEVFLSGDDAFEELFASGLVSAYVGGAASASSPTARHTPVAAASSSSGAMRSHRDCHSQPGALESAAEAMLDAHEQQKQAAAVLSEALRNTQGTVAQVKLEAEARVKAALQETLHVREELETQLLEAKSRVAILEGQTEALRALSLEQIEQLSIEMHGTISKVQQMLATKREEEDSRRKRAAECVVCMEKPRDTAFIPCGHAICCSACATSLRNCPSCRGQITGRLRVFQ